MSYLRMIDVGSREGIHIRMRDPAPDHLAPVNVSTPAHFLTCRFVVQEFNCRSRDRNWILERYQHSAPVIQKFGCVPVRSRDDRLAGAQGIRQGSRYSLCFESIRSNVNVGGTDQRSHFVRADKPVEKHYLIFNTKFL